MSRTRGSIPKTACKPREAEDMALAVCAGSTIGCAAAADAVENKHGGYWSFLASPACDAMASKLMDRQYGVSDAWGSIVTQYFDTVGDMNLRSNSGFEQFIGAIFKGIAINRYYKSFKSCVADVEYNCVSKYEQFIEKTGGTVNECNKYKLQASNQKQKIDNLDRELHKIENDIEMVKKDISLSDGIKFCQPQA